MFKSIRNSLIVVWAGIVANCLRVDKKYVQNAITVVFDDKSRNLRQPRKCGCVYIPYIFSLVAMFTRFGGSL